MFCKLSFVGLFLFGSLNNVYCDTSCDSYECDDVVISASDYYYCVGYESCMDSEISLSGGYDLYCDGEDACYNSNVTTTSTSGLIKMRGYQAGYYAELTGHSHHYCDGYQGCYYADIYGYSDYNLYCYGYKGCANANIYTTDEIFGYSYHSLYEATIDSEGENTVDIYLLGYEAGYNLNVFCRDGSTCKLYCDGTGCLNTYLWCEEGSTCGFECYSNDDCESPELEDYESAEFLLSKSNMNKLITNTKTKRKTKIKKEKKLNKSTKLKNNNNNSKTNNDLVLTYGLVLSGWLASGVIFYVKRKNKQNQ
jgi:hypothetical protein